MRGSGKPSSLHRRVMKLSALRSHAWYGGWVAGFRDTRVRRGFIRVECPFFLPALSPHRSVLMCAADEIFPGLVLLEGRCAPASKERHLLFNILKWLSAGCACGIFDKACSSGNVLRGILVPRDGRRMYFTCASDADWHRPGSSIRGRGKRWR